MKTKRNELVYSETILLKHYKPKTETEARFQAHTEGLIMSITELIPHDHPIRHLSHFKYLEQALNERVKSIVKS